MDYISIQGIHYHISDATDAYIREKLNKLSYLREHIVDGTLRVIHEKHEYAVEIDLHFNHGAKLHAQASHAQLYPAVENLMDKLKVAASDEKKKIKDHHNRQAGVREGFRALTGYTIHPTAAYVLHLLFLRLRGRGTHNAEVNSLGVRPHGHVLSRLLST